MSDYGDLARDIFGHQVRGGRMAQGYVTAKNASDNSYTVALSSESGAPAAEGIKSFVPLVVGDTVWLMEGPGGIPIAVGHQEVGWNVVGASGQPPFLNGWRSWAAHMDGANEDPRFRKVMGIVHLNGLAHANNVTSGHMFTLPSRYRPSRRLQFTIDINSNHGHCDVNSDGSVIVGSYSQGGWHSIANISFPADQ